MIKQIQRNNSTAAAKRFRFGQLLRSALAAGIVAGFAASASAQSGVLLPSFPTHPASLSLPVSQDSSYHFTAAPQQSRSASASKRVASLLGLKKQTPTTTFSQSTPTLALSAFPSTEPTLAVTHCESEKVVAADSHAPSICRSSSGISDCPKVDGGDGVMRASANESVWQSTNPTEANVQSAVALAEPTATDSSSDSSSEASSESLTDIEIPTSAVHPTQKAHERLAELVKRPPVMQLSIGGNVGHPLTNSIANQSISTPVKFSLSDSGESHSPKSSVQLVVANPMNVRVEGEPMITHMVARPATSSETPAPALRSPVEASSRSSRQKVLSDTSTISAPVNGERLEVGLHESANVETAQAISGLSVEHPELCQVLKCGERCVSFVGLKAGQTRVALFTTDASGERKIEIRDVVIASSENLQADMKTLASEIGLSVRSMYPNSQIEVIAESEGLTVQGYASSEEEAKKIVSLVRRTSLRPVVDRLATYK